MAQAFLPVRLPGTIVAVVNLASNRDDLVVEPARAAELAIVIEILDQAAEWMLQRGIRQWDSPSPPEVWERMAREIKKADVYLARLATTSEPPRTAGSASGHEHLPRTLADRPEAVGTVRFEWAAAPLWPTEADAGYIHTMAIRPSHMGRHLGRKLLAWAIEHVRSRGKQFARLDCISDNRRLRDYYEAAAFRYCGDGVVGAYRLSLYELPL